MTKHVALIYGGMSAEREVSLASGRDCAAALETAGYRVTRIDVGSDLGSLLQKLETAKPDVIFNALHGRWGEDGCVQGLLELLRIPYTHSGVLASAIAMDKQMTKRIAAAHGVISPEGRVVPLSELANGDIMPRPYVVKPVHEGSSVGVRIVHEGDNRPTVEHDGWRFGDAVLVERFIPGRELTVAVMGDRPLAVTELRPKVGFYDYEAKYTEGRTEHIVPAPIPAAVTERALNAALTVHQVLGCRGVTRSDFRYDDSEAARDCEGSGLYFLEVNTQPGMAPLSLVPEQAAYVGLPFPDLCAWIVENAACDS